MRLNKRHLLGFVSAAQLALVGCTGDSVLKARALSTGTGGDQGLGGDQSTGGMAGADAAGGSGTGGVIAGTGGSGTGGQAGAAGGHGGSMGGMGGGGTGGMGMGGTGGRPVGTGKNGDACSHGDQCQSGWCAVEGGTGVCCNVECAGTCYTCFGTKEGVAKGTCTFADSGSDPHNDCPADDLTAKPCGKVGGCNGTGACTMVAAGAVCGTMQSCSADMTGVIAKQKCDGNGMCKDETAETCNGFLCSAGACNTVCTDDTACVSGGFCAAQKCVGTPNLAGNGDAETGTTAGWLPANGGRAVAISDTTMVGYANTGRYSIVETGRQHSYEGPAYNLPTGLGSYTISFYAMQTEDGAFDGVPQVELKCRDTTASGNGAYYISVGSAFSFSLPAMMWVKVSATINTATDSATGVDCLPTGTPPGVVRGAILYLNQPSYDSTSAPMPDALPNLYMDDVVVTVPPGQNLVGNANFEATFTSGTLAGFTDGWSATTGAPIPVVTTTFAHGGAASLVQSARTTPGAGIKYALPLGAARYQVSYWVMQTGTSAHDLVLQPSYTCSASGSMPVNPTPITLTGAAAGNWVKMTGSFSLPNANETAGCVMSQASLTLQQGETGVCGSTVECPDLYVDDVAIAVQ